MHRKRQDYRTYDTESGVRTSHAVTQLPGGLHVHADILVVEDDPGILELIGLQLESGEDHVTKVATVFEAEAQARLALPDLILLDWMLPMARDSIGRDSCAARPAPATRRSSCSAPGRASRTRWRDSTPGSMTMWPSRLRRASSYRALRRCCGGAPELAAASVEIDGLRLNHASREITADGTPLHLGPTEFRTLQFFMTHTERMHTREQLVAAVWGEAIDVEGRTVDMNVGRLRDALKATKHDALLETVRGGGYRFRTARRSGPS